MSDKAKLTFVTNLYPSENEPYKGSFIKNIFMGFRRLGVDAQLIKLEYIGYSKYLKILSYMFFYTKSFISALSSKKGDVFYIHYVSHSSLGILFASFFRKLNIVANVHGTDVLPEVSHGKYSSLINVTLSKLILHRSSIIIFPSEYFKGIITEKYNICSITTYVSPSGGVDGSIFYPFKKNKIENEVVNFGYIGRIEEAKGVNDLLVSYVELLKTSSNVMLTIIGSGSGYEKAKILASGMDSIKVIPGLAQSLLAERYSRFDYLIFPSHHESLGLVPIEAMMCGIPVITSRIGAVNSYIKDELISFSFEPGNKIELLKVMKKAIVLDNVSYSKLCSLSLDIADDFKSDKVIVNLLGLFKNKFNI